MVPLYCYYRVGSPPKSLPLSLLLFQPCSSLRPYAGRSSFGCASGRGVRRRGEIKAKEERLSDAGLDRRFPELLHPHRCRHSRRNLLRVGVELV